jgi:hypothetical protein
MCQRWKNIKMIMMIRDEWFQQENKATLHECKTYRSHQSAYLCTTRFNDQTYLQNRRFCVKFKKKSFYCNPHALPANIPADGIVYVIEMNNTKDKIAGIGKIKNRLKYNVYNVYEEEFYNQNYFEGDERIDAEEFNETETQFIQSLEQQCFHGRGHLKRGHRMLSFPQARLGTCMKNGLDIIGTIEKIFHRKKKNL